MEFNYYTTGDESGGYSNESLDTDFQELFFFRGAFSPQFVMPVTVYVL